MTIDPLKTNSTTLLSVLSVLFLMKNLLLAAPSESYEYSKINQKESSKDNPGLSSILRAPENHEPQQEPEQLRLQDNYLYSFPTQDHSAQPNSHDESVAEAPLQNRNDKASKTILINFNNVSIIEYIRFVSRISNRNFVFDENDLQFNVTIISEEPATVDNIMAALLQELRIHDLTLIEDNNNLIIHKNPKVTGISRVVSDELDLTANGSDIITQVFRPNTLDAERASIILRPLVSAGALVEVLKPNYLIVTDITANVTKIAQLIKTLDAPNSGLVIGQYVSRMTHVNTLIPLAQQIMQPISQDQPLTFVLHPVTNSIFIVSSPFLVERTIAILQYLDDDQGSTRILNLNELRLGSGAQRGTTTDKLSSGLIESSTKGSNVLDSSLSPQGNAGGAPTAGSAPNEGIFRTPSGQWQPAPQGGWIFKPEVPTAQSEAQQQRLSRGEPAIPPVGSWSRDYEGNWNFNEGIVTEPGGPSPRGRWTLDKDGNWVFELDIGETFNPSPLSRQFEGLPLLPGGSQKQSKFVIAKLRYRKGESVEPAIRQIADTLQQNHKGNEDLIATIRSVQWIPVSNSLIFSGPQEALDKALLLVQEIDKPMRQVFVEMLILETTLQDSLNFGVTYGSRFGGGNLTGSQGFSSGSTPLIGALGTAGISGLGQKVGQQNLLVPNGTNFAQDSGFNLGVIGQKITHCGTEFGSIGALVNALHDRTKDEVISNPKILIEDNSPAEIFVGLNTPYRTQSISNDVGTVITSNFEYRDIGTRLKVTPYLGNSDIVALDIEEEVSTIVDGLITNANTASTSPGPTTRINRTTTRVHIPDSYFLIISGMMQNEESRERNQVPCLGGVPLLGAGFSAKFNKSSKRNLMIFIRPKIVDTEEEIDLITKHQQDIYDYKNSLKKSDEYETVEALDLFNIPKTLHPEDKKNEFDYDSCGNK